MPSTAEAAAKKILIVRTSALGDVVHTLPALEALKSLFPEAIVHWIVEPLAARLLEGHPLIDRLIVLPRQHWKRQARNPLQWLAILGEIWRLSRSLRKERFDVTLDFHCNLRSAVILLLAGGRRKIGFHPSDIAESGGALFTTHKAAKATRKGAEKVEDKTAQ